MSIDWATTLAAIWRSKSQQLRPVRNLDLHSLDSLIGIDEQAEALVENTQRFLRQQPCNDALLWGARGTGKSTLIKAVFNKFCDQGLRLVEIYKTDLQDLPEIVDLLRVEPYQFILFCDDFSFEENDATYVVLKTLLEGSIEKRPDNTVLYVTSNRRHLLPEYMDENRDTIIKNGEVHYSDAVEEKISLSDRFGLWLSFYPGSDELYLRMVDQYFPNYSGDREVLHKSAIAFARRRGAKSGRTAQQFYRAAAEIDETS